MKPETNMDTANEKVTLVLYGNAMESFTGQQVSAPEFLAALLSNQLTQVAVLGVLDIVPVPPGETPASTLSQVAFTGRFGWRSTAFYFSDGTMFIGAARSAIVNNAPATQAQFVKIEPDLAAILPAVPRGRWWPQKKQTN